MTNRSDTLMLVMYTPAVQISFHGYYNYSFATEIPENWTEFSIRPITVTIVKRYKNNAVFICVAVLPTIK